MALGRTALNDIACNQVDIGGLVPKNENSWNTFQYVVRNLREWADETTIGNESLESLQKITNNVEKLNKATHLINDKISKFVDQQRRYNENNL